MDVWSSSWFSQVVVAAWAQSRGGSGWRRKTRETALIPDPRSQPRRALGPQAERLEKRETLLAGNDPLDRPYRGLPYRPVSCRSMNRGAILMIRGCHLQILIPRPLSHHHKRSILSFKTLVHTYLPPTSNLQATINMGGQGRDGGKAKPLKVRATPPSILQRCARLTDRTRPPRRRRRSSTRRTRLFLRRSALVRTNPNPVV